MCFYHDYGPEVYRETTPVARKAYKCCECRGAIATGEKHLCVFGVWEGRAETLRTCRRCAWQRCRLRTIEELHGCTGPEREPAFGNLWEAWSEGDYGVEECPPEWYDFQELVPVPRYETREPIPRDRSLLVQCVANAKLGRGFVLSEEGEEE